jgi:hypothetical protein
MKVVLDLPLNLTTLAASQGMLHADDFWTAEQIHR